MMLIDWRTATTKQVASIQLTIGDVILARGIDASDHVAPASGENNTVD
jgi:hypothetical protein